MRITDKNVAEFVGVTDRALRKWKKPQQEIDGTAVYLPHGKHNLYRGAKLAYYLLNYPTYIEKELTKEEKEEYGEEFCEPFNNLERLEGCAERLKKLVELGCNGKYKDDILQKVEELEEIINGLQDAASL